MNAVTPPGGEQSLGPTARRMILGSQLRRMREDAGITRQEAGYSIRGSESKISRLELGRVGFKERDVADLLTMYGMTDPAERQQFLDMVKESNEPGWWRRYGDLMPSWFNDLVGLEEAAARIQVWEPLYVTGLLQTEDYARAIMSHGRKDMVNEQVDRRVALRMRRQKMLSRPDAPRLWLVLDESVLYRPIGDREVLKGQIDHLLEMIQQPNISVQVLPFDRSGYSADSAFSLLRFAEEELPNIAYTEYLTGAHYIDKREEIERYSRALDMLAVDAETPDRSRQMLMKRCAEI
ncbi:helix-turn-helix domain-containing protein [Amycolatopsis roodepoortensis]|uniref:Transcriptional regulator with XRE-family HTH domain n=1 Tax=Amycolatopsis roodepoortensis TaxID=700274 RepID=A0ABR9L2C4_9PSEU|nr:helix-turn-helix transcriptional regulator [Amycolatopsis roodepoortensis]MBE1574884.1 transcriptional regulator with XRE-family HTH domain [Amycolatopsis roodepoortensis]